MIRNKLLPFFIVMLPLVSNAKQITQTMNSDHLVPTPILKPGFEFNIAALALKPGGSNLNFVINNKELPSQSPSWKEQELQPSYTAAFELGIRYIFANLTGIDSTLDWTHLNSTTSDTFAADGASYFLGPDYEIGGDAIPIRNASGRVSFSYDVINLDMGQFMKVGDYVILRLFGGLSTGILREQTVSTYSGTTTGTFAGPFSTRQTVTSQFTGVGPHFGMQANISTNRGVGFLGEAGITALVGAMDSKTKYLSTAAKLIAVFGQTWNPQTIKDQRVFQVIPGFEAKLGMNYQYEMMHDLLLTISAGYQAAVYINAISQYLPQTIVSGQNIDSGGVFVATMSHTLSNYSVHGPFVNFALHI